MEFNEKVQLLRKQANLTQEELADALFVSRTAVSKWESGRGYPNIESLKAIAKFFGVSIDELLSGDELLSIAEEDTRKQQDCIRDQIFGLLDCGATLYFVLPFFGQKVNDHIQSVSILNLIEVSPYLKIAYIVFVVIGIGCGFTMLLLQNCQSPFWIKHKITIPLVINLFAEFLFIISLQPYAAAFLFFLIVIKVIMLLKRQ